MVRAAWAVRGSCGRPPRTRAGPGRVQGSARRALKAQPVTQHTAYLSFLVDHGYTLSDVERLTCATWPDPDTRDGEAADE